MEKVILFFTAGMVPTDEEKEAFAKIPGAVWRNAGHDDGSVEGAAAVAGAVPAQYADYPRYEADGTITAPQQQTGGAVAQWPAPDPKSSLNTAAPTAPPVAGSPAFPAWTGGGNG